MRSGGAGSRSRSSSSWRLPCRGRRRPPNVGWIILNWREAGLLIAGLIVFPLIITGVVLNTIFLVREIRRNEQHEAFITPSPTS